MEVKKYYSLDGKDFFATEEDALTYGEQPKESWESELDELFNTDEWHQKYDGYIRTKVKSFIQSLLTQQKEEIKEHLIKNWEEDNKKFGGIAIYEDLINYINKQI